MALLRVAGVALLTALLILLQKELLPTAALSLRFAGSILLFSAALPLFIRVVEYLKGRCEGEGAVLLSALGLALMAELTASLLRDLGEPTLGDGVLLFAKLEILLLALPKAEELFQMVTEFLT